MKVGVAYIVLNDHDSVAQLVEQLTLNQWVESSSLSGVTLDFQICRQSVPRLGVPTQTLDQAGFGDDRSWASEFKAPQFAGQPS
jgi:hypothetical protein